MKTKKLPRYIPTLAVFLSIIHVLPCDAQLEENDQSRIAEINNVFRRRGASLRNHKEVSIVRTNSPSSEPVSGSDTRISQSEAYVRSIRQSGHFDNYPALKLLLARRQHYAEPEPDSSETVIVKSLPQISQHGRTIQYYVGGREPLARLPRDPSPTVHNFQLEHRDQAEIHRGTFLETPRSASLIAPVQNFTGARASC